MDLGLRPDPRSRWSGYRDKVTGIDRDELREVSAAVLAVTAHLSVRDVLRTILTSARKLVGARYADGLVLRGRPDESSFNAFWLAKDGRVTAGMHVNDWDSIEPIKRLVGEGRAVEPERLAAAEEPLVTVVS